MRAFPSVVSSVIDTSIEVVAIFSWKGVRVCGYDSALVLVAEGKGNQNTCPLKAVGGLKGGRLTKMGRNKRRMRWTWLAQSARTSAGFLALDLE